MMLNKNKYCLEYVHMQNSVGMNVIFKIKLLPFYSIKKKEKKEKQKST